MGKVVRDSISSGQQCSDMFGLNSPNEAALQRARARAYKDTLECVKYEKEGEFLLRIQGENGNNPFLEVGKYFLMTLLYPPYFLLWAAPKWFGQKGAPKLYKMLQELKNTGRDFADRLALPLKKTFHRVSALIKGWGRWSADAAYQQLERLKKALAPFDQIADALKKLAAWRLPFSFPKLGHFGNFFHHISFPAVSLKEQWEEARIKVDLLFAQFEQFAKAAVKPLDAFSKKIQHFFSTSKEFSQSIKEVLKTLRNAFPMDTFKERVKQIASTFYLLSEPLSKAAKWGKEKYVQAAERVEHGLDRLAQMFPQPVINLFSFFMRFRKEESFKKRRKISFKQGAAKIKEQIKRGWQKLGQGKKVIKKIIAKAHQSTLIIGRYTFRFLKMLGALLYKIIKQAAIMLYLTFLWMRVFIMFVSKRVKSSLMQRLSIKA